jgi:ElaB/YqjD/DUF883 family membrane-anchored ribosome-binding protein
VQLASGLQKSVTLAVTLGVMLAVTLARLTRRRAGLAGERKSIMNQTNIADVHADSSNESRADRRRRLRQEGHEAGMDRGRMELHRWLEAGRNLSTQVDEQVQKRPYVAIGAAAGIGFVAGSLFGTRLGQLVMALGLGYLTKSMLGDRASFESLQAGLEKMTGESGAVD